MSDEAERRPAAHEQYRNALEDTTDEDEEADVVGVPRNRIRKLKDKAAASKPSHRRIIIDSSGSDEEDDESSDGGGSPTDGRSSDLASALENLALSPVETSFPTRNDNRSDAYEVDDSSDGDESRSTGSSIEPPRTSTKSSGKIDAPIVVMDTTNDDSSSGDEEVLAEGVASVPSITTSCSTGTSGEASAASSGEDVTPRRLSWQSPRPSPDKKKTMTSEPKVAKDAGMGEPVDGAWTFDDATEEYYLSGRSEFCDDEWPGLRIPQKLYERLYLHQKVGVQWMASMYEKQVGGILGDDMGLGKTFQTLTYLGGLMRARTIRNALVICPVSVLRTWEREGRDILQQSCVPRVSITVVSSDVSRQRRISLLEDALKCSPKRPHLVVTTYGLVTSSPLDFVRPAEEESCTAWDYVVCDEGHKLKNPSTQVSKSCKRICRSDETRRLLLTGTPIQNNLKELWALFDWACSGRLLGNIRRFKCHFGDPIEDGRHKNASEWTIRTAEKANKELQKKLRPHFLQRLKSNEFKDALPTKRELVVFTHLSHVQRSMYEEYVNHGGKVKAVLAGETSSPLEAIAWLKKLCGHPSLVSESNTRDFSPKKLIRESTKLGVLVDLLKRMRKSGHRTLVFSQSTKMLDIIEIVLTPKMNLSRIDGGTKEKERQRRVDSFNSKGSNVDVMLLSTKAAGIGLTLTGADRAIIYDPSWNPADDSQAVDRCFRIGQTKNVTVYRFISAGTVEEAMYKKVVHKDGIKRTVMSGDGCATERHFDKDELRKLFQLAPAGECEMLSKFNGKASRRVVGSSGKPSFLETLDGVVGISSHDLLYTNAVIKVDDPETPFAGTPLKNRGRRALEGTKLNFGSALSNEPLELVPLGTKRQNKLAQTKGSRPSSETNQSHTKVHSNHVQTVNKRISHGEKENEVVEHSEHGCFSETGEKVESLVMCDRTEEAMGLLLDVLEAGQLEGKDNLDMHKKITALAIQLQWL